MSAAGWLSGCPCMADDPIDIKTSSKETILSSNSQFSSISAMVVSPDGVLNVADQVCTPSTNHSFVTPK